MEEIKLKRCSHCKEYKNLECFSKNKSNKDGIQIICKECEKQYNKRPEVIVRRREYDKKRNKTKKRKDSRKKSNKTYKETINGRLKILLDSAKNRANKKHIEFELDLPWILFQWKNQNGHCLLSGVKFDLILNEAQSRSPNAPSIDRIDTKIGYIKNNCRLITNQCNISKNEWTDNELYNMCLAIVKKREEMI